MNIKKISTHISVYMDGLNTGVIEGLGKTTLIGCSESIDTKYMPYAILCTSYRRTLHGGLYLFAGNGTKIYAPADEEQLFSHADEFWNDEKQHYHLYYFRPDHDVLPKSITPHKLLKDNDKLTICGCDITVLYTPGDTDGALSYVINDDGMNIVFCGNLIGDGGVIPFLHHTTKGLNGLMDYHGFLGAVSMWEKSLQALAFADVLVPSRGNVIYNPKECILLVCKRLDELYESHARISSLNYYFSEACTPQNPIKPAKCVSYPSFLTHIGDTSVLIRSKSGRGFLVDCGGETAFANILALLSKNELKALDGVFVTHYHDDHVDMLAKLYEQTNCPIYTSKAMFDILANPSSYLLPCLSPVKVPVTGLYDGEVIEWEEFKFTIFHFPGQTLYHSGMLMEGSNLSILFGGDSFSPTGIDDYCPQNRNFFGEGRGYRHCLEIIRKFKPDMVINQHQEQGVVITREFLDEIERELLNRERITNEISPWYGGGFSTDSGSVRVYPYERDATVGECVAFELVVTNHSYNTITIAANPIAPMGFEVTSGETFVSPMTSGLTDPKFGTPDGIVAFQVTALKNAVPGRYCIPVHITMDGVSLGSLTNAIINVN